jgi:hypothetical protein
VVVDASGIEVEALAEELRGDYGEVLALPPDALLTSEGEIRSFADIGPYRRRRGEMLRAAV